MEHEGDGDIVIRTLRTVLNGSREKKNWNNTRKKQLYLILPNKVVQRFYCSDRTQFRFGRSSGKSQLHGDAIHVDRY